MLRYFLSGLMAPELVWEALPVLVRVRLVFVWESASWSGSSRIWSGRRQICSKRSGTANVRVIVIVIRTRPEPIRKVGWSSSSPFPVRNCLCLVYGTEAEFEAQFAVSGLFLIYDTEAKIRGPETDRFQLEIVFSWLAAQKQT